MNKKRKFNRGIKYLLLVALAISSFLLPRLTAFAAENGLQNVNGNKTITGKLVGQYSLNYTGNINFYGYEKQGASGGAPNTLSNTWNGNGAFDSNYEKVKGKLTKGWTDNSTFADLKKSDGATGIKAAYLVWQTSVQGKNSEVTVLKKAQSTPVYFAAANGTLQTITPQYTAVDKRKVQNGTTEDKNTGTIEKAVSSYTFSCMYADVTSYVQQYGFTTYGVAGIPYALSKKYNKDTGSHMGESCSNWQLIVVEENPKENVRAVSIKVGSQFNYTWEDNPNPPSDKEEDQYIWKDNPMKMSLSLGDYQTKQYSDENTKVKGQLMVLGISSVASTESEEGSGKLSVTVTDQDKGKTAYKKSNVVSNSYLYKDGKITGTYSASAIRGSIWNFSIKGTGKNSPGFNAKNFSVSVTDPTWVTLYAVGMAVDVADYDPIGKQDTKIENNKATITGSETVDTDQKNTGYYDGSMVVTLDDDLEKPESASFTVYNKNKDSKKTFKYNGSNTAEIKYNASKHTLTFQSTDDYINIGNGSYVSYTIKAPLKDEPEKATITNKHQVTGKLCSIGAQTNIEKKHPEVSSSAKVPFPVGLHGYFTLKVVGADGTTSKIKVKVDTDTKDFENTPEVHAILSIVGNESTNNHGVTLVDASGNPVSRLRCTLGAATTAYEDGAENKDKYYLKKDDGTIVYKSKWKSVIPFRIRYDKEAYTYATGKATIVENESRFNDKEYDWKSSKPHTLDNKHVWHSDVQETMAMQVNVSNAGIAFVEGVKPVNGEYTITLKHPELTITYKDGEDGKAKSYKQENALFYKEGATVNLMNTTHSHLKFTRSGYEPVTQKEWYRKNSDGTKKYYDQDARYLLEKVKNFTDGDDFKTKNVNLYVNWKKVLDEITVYYRSAGTGDSSDKWKNNNTPSAHCTNADHKHSAYYHLDGTRTIQHAEMLDKSHSVDYTVGGKKKTETCKYKTRQKDANGNVVYSYSKTTIKKNEIDAKTAKIDLLNTTTALNAPAGTSATGYWRVGSLSGPQISYSELTGDAAVNAYHLLSQYANSDGKVYVYADWMGKSHTLTFNANGGTMPEGGVTAVTITVRSSDYHDVSWNTPSRKGYKFLGWYNAPSGGTQVYDEDGLCKNEGKYWSSNVCVYDGDYTVYAHWEAQEASYTVRHWKQKADGDAASHDQNNYELAETETKKAQIGTSVTPPVKTYAGFVSPAVQTGTVTADGKLVIDYFYERQFYNLILNAGTGIEATYGGGAYRYGQSVTIDASLKTGYHWSHWSGSFEQDTKNYTFTMPMSNVELTANGEANKYIIHFDPNGGAGHIDDIEATYDTDVTLPDVWNADGTAAYVKYTLDGVNVTGDVISGVIPKGMMAGYEEEETEESEEAENPDEEDSENKNDGSEEDTDNKEDSVEKDSEKEQEDSKNVENAESDVAENVDNENNDADDSGIAESTDNSDDTEQKEKTVSKKDKKDDDALDGVENIEDTKKAEAPKKKVYASIFMGWSLEDGKDTFIPQWKAGDVVRNLVAEDGGEITLYAVWDDCPWIQAEDLYYTLDQAQSGFITEAEILSHATASDREDGSPIAPGTNPAVSDPSLFTSFTIPDYQAEEFTSLQHDFATSENLTVVDHVGNTYVKQIMVHVTDTTPKKLTQMDLTGVTRFINSKYYNKSFEEGGLEDNSIWKVDPEYRAALESALNNMDHDTPIETYVFSKETIKEMKQYVETHGIGNSKEPDALNNFYNQFLAPNKKYAL